MFSDRQVWAKCVDPIAYQTAHHMIAPQAAVRSGSSLSAIPFASFGCITLCEEHKFKIKDNYSNFFRCLNF